MPSSNIFTPRDPDEYRAAIRAGDVSLLVTGRGEFRTSLTRIDLHRLWMQRSELSLAAIVHAAVWQGRGSILFVANAPSKPMRQGGFEVASGDLVFHSVGAEHHLRTPADFQWGAMSLALDDLASFGRALSGREIGPPAVTRALRPRPAAMARLLSLHEAAGHLAATVPDILAHPEVARSIEQELVRAMVNCLGNPEATEHRSFIHRQLTVMRRFELLLEERRGEPLYMTEVCAAIGATDRTLRHYCHEHLGMSPHRYLWLRRMQQARRVLSLADRVRTSVTAIANDHGFAELGRFAVAYRDLFGESPSATLRRPPDEIATPKSARKGDPFADPA